MATPHGSDSGSERGVSSGGRGARAVAAIDPRLLEILVCPLTKTTLEWDAARQELISRAARLAFPVRDGVPIMLAHEARALEG